MSGEPWSYHNFIVNNDTGLFLHAVMNWSGQWDDWSNEDSSRGYAVEWSADCNGDGIVDYGQILNGSLADNDGNGIPDICVQESNAVQWAEADGGNGHWYQIRITEAECWTEAKESAVALGGQLVSMETSNEFTFCSNLVNTIPDKDPDTGMAVYVGLEQLPGAAEPGVIGTGSQVFHLLIMASGDIR